MMIAEYIFKLKNGKEVIMSNKDALSFHAHLVINENLEVLVFVNFERGKTKFKLK